MASPTAQDSAPSGLRRLRRAVFGDWHPLLRDPLDLMRLSFAAAAVTFFLAGSIEYGVRMTGTFLLLVIAQRLRAPRFFDLLFIIAMGLQAWGNAARLFENIDWWDNLVHFVVPMSSVGVLYVLLVRLELAPPLAEEQRPRQRLGLVIFAALVGLSIGALYEVYEYVANRWLGATGIEIGYADTIFDLVLDTAGSLAGGVLLMFWAATRWSTERRDLSAGDRRR